MVDDIPTKGRNDLLALTAAATPSTPKMPLAVRNKHDWYNLSFGVKPSQLFHGTSCDEGCNFIVNPQVSPPSVCGVLTLHFAGSDPERFSTGLMRVCSRER